MVGNEGFGACGHEPQIQQPAERGDIIVAGAGHHADPRAGRRLVMHRTDRMVAVRARACHQLFG